jgi:hypothetical protein
MRIHAVIDEELFRAAQAACPEARTKTALLEEALKALVERSAARELARLVRNREIEIAPVPRRRPVDAGSS